MLSLLAIIPIFFILLLNQNVIDICAEAADKLHKKHPLIYVYDWPELLDVYANYTDRDHSSHGVEFPEWTSNKGTGRIIDARRMEHKTSQFSLFKIIYERMLVSEYRTYDITKATTFFIPFDIGMHAAFLKANGRMRRSDCPLYEQVKKRLNSSVYFQRNYGHDHILVNSVNQNLNYFLRAPNCVAIIQLCWNCTKLSIDEYMFIAKDREFELKDRGINWHAVPFPSDYHYRYSSRYNYNNGGGSSKAPWAENIYDRSTIVSFVGGSRRFNQIATDIREALIKQCQLHSKECSFDTYKHGKNERGLHKLSRQSTFCFQPPGDMPTRKSLFDSMLSGCIPVLFHPLTARYMYEWHLGQLWEEIPIHFDTLSDYENLITNKTDYVKKLIDLYCYYPHVVRKKQELLSKYAHSLQYSLVDVDSKQMKQIKSMKFFTQDAFDIIVEKVTSIHTGLLSHNRTSSYLDCGTIASGKHLMQTSDNCIYLNTTNDPYYPPSTIDYFHHV